MRRGSERGRRLPKVVDRGEWDSIIAGAALDRRDATLALRDRAILAVLFGSGIRSAELCALELGDVGWGKGTLHVRHGKGDKERIAPCAPWALNELRAYLDVRPEPRAGAGDPLFVSRKGGHLDTSSVRRLVKAAGAAAGMGAQLHPHRARHSNVTEQVRQAIRKGRPIGDVAQNVGHASLETLAIYTHLAVEERAETVSDL